MNGKPVLHVGDTVTNFQNDIFIERKTADDPWVEFLKCWASVYIGLPEIIRVDRQSTSSNFRVNDEDIGIQLQFSGIE